MGLYILLILGQGMKNSGWNISNKNLVNIYKTFHPVIASFWYANYRSYSKDGELLNLNCIVLQFHFRHISAFKFNIDKAFEQAISCPINQNILDLYGPNSYTKKAPPLICRHISVINDGNATR